MQPQPEIKLPGGLSEVVWNCIGAVESWDVLIHMVAVANLNEKNLCFRVGG